MESKSKRINTAFKNCGTVDEGLESLHYESNAL